MHGLFELLWKCWLNFTRLNRKKMFPELTAGQFRRPSVILSTIEVILVLACRVVIQLTIRLTLRCLINRCISPGDLSLHDLVIIGFCSRPFCCFTVAVCPVISLLMVHGQTQEFIVTGPFSVNKKAPYPLTTRPRGRSITLGQFIRPTFSFRKFHI